MTSKLPPDPIVVSDPDADEEEEEDEEESDDSSESGEDSDEDADSSSAESDSDESSAVSEDSESSEESGSTQSQPAVGSKDIAQLRRPAASSGKRRQPPAVEETIVAPTDHALMYTAPDGTKIISRSIVGVSNGITKYTRLGSVKDGVPEIVVTVPSSAFAPVQKAILMKRIKEEKA